MHKPTHGRYQCLHCNRMAANMQKPSHTKKSAHLTDWNSIKIPFFFLPHFTYKGNRRQDSQVYQWYWDYLLPLLSRRMDVFLLQKQSTLMADSYKCCQTVTSEKCRLNAHEHTQHNTSGKEHYFPLHNSPVHSMPRQWQLKPWDLACFFVAIGLPTMTCYKVASLRKNLSASSKSHAGGNVPSFFQSD